MSLTNEAVQKRRHFVYMRSLIKRKILSSKDGSEILRNRPKVLTLTSLESN